MVSAVEMYGNGDIPVEIEYSGGIWSMHKIREKLNKEFGESKFIYTLKKAADKQRWCDVYINGKLAYSRHQEGDK